MSAPRKPESKLPGLKLARRIVANPVLAFGPGGNSGTLAALDRLTTQEFTDFVHDLVAFHVAALTDAIRREEAREKGRKG